MTYVKASVRRPSGNPGNGIQPKDQLVIYDVDDILSFPQRNDAGVVIEDDIVMKAGRYAIGIYLTPGTAEISSNSDGETDAEGYTPSIKFNHPGNEQEIREFKTNWLSKKCIVVLRYCSGKPADLIGTPCNPCKLSVSYTGSNESNTNELTFTQISKGDDIAIYRGTDTLEEPVAVVEAGATDIDYQTDGQYQLSAGAAKIAGVTGGSHGSVITLMGCSGVAPTVEAGGNLLLKGGKTFTASEGSQLTLRAFNDGSEAMKWIEQSRYEA